MDHGKHELIIGIASEKLKAISKLFGGLETRFQMAVFRWQSPGSKVQHSAFRGSKFKAIWPVSLVPSV